MIPRCTIAEGVMKHAKEHYYGDEWGLRIIDCFSLAELIDFWDRCNYRPRTVKGAIAWHVKMEKIFKAIYREGTLEKS